MQPAASFLVFSILVIVLLFFYVLSNLYFLFFVFLYLYFCLMILHVSIFSFSCGAQLSDMSSLCIYHSSNLSLMKISNFYFLMMKNILHVLFQQFYAKLWYLIIYLRHYLNFISIFLNFNENYDFKFHKDFEIKEYFNR